MKVRYGVLTAVSAGRNVNMGQKNSFSSRTGRKKGSRSSVWKVDTDTQDVGCNWDNDDDSSTDVSVGLNESKQPPKSMLIKSDFLYTRHLCRHRRQGSFLQDLRSDDLGSECLAITFHLFLKNIFRI